MKLNYDITKSNYFGKVYIFKLNCDKILKLLQRVWLMGVSKTE